MANLTAYETHLEPDCLPPAVTPVASTVDAVTALVVLAAAPPPTRPYCQSVCTNCNKKGHFVETYYKAHPELKPPGRIHDKPPTQSEQSSSRGATTVATHLLTSMTLYTVLHDIEDLHHQIVAL